MYHIKSNGEPGICKAAPGNCPLAGAANHYHSASEARYAYEHAMSSSSVGSLSKSAGAQQAPAETLDDESYNSREAELDYTPAQVKEKFKKDILGHSYRLSGKNNPGEPGMILEQLFGKAPDDSPAADLGTVELKTLIDHSLEHRISLGDVKIRGNMSKLREEYFGRSFQHNLKVNKWSHVGDNYYTLYLDRKQRRLRLLIADSSKEYVSTNDFGWNFELLENKVDQKLEHIAVGLYSKEQSSDGQSQVTFTGLAMGGFTRESFLDKLESGEVSVEFRFSGHYARTTFSSSLSAFSDEMESIKTNGTSSAKQSQ